MCSETGFVVETKDGYKKLVLLLFVETNDKDEVPKFSIELVFKFVEKYWVFAFSGIEVAPLDCS